MNELRDWQKQMRKHRHRNWNGCVKPKFQKAEYEYARRKGVNVIYVDTETGEIMQFGASKPIEEWAKQWDGMFPDRKMTTIFLKDYKKLIENLTQKQE